jgi:heptosyltransferase III
MGPPEATRILIYKLGSIGDFVVALPSLHLVRHRYPKATITLLTNLPVDGRAAAAPSVLDGTGLIDRYIAYPAFTRDPSEIAKVWKVIRSFRPDLLVYLAEPRRILSVYRDWIFFLLCGVRRWIGIPFSPDLRNCRPDEANAELWEREAQRLGRCLAALGPIDMKLPDNWSLHVSDAEHREVDRLLREETGDRDDLRLLGFSLGTKQPVKDWGDDNWRAVLEGLRSRDFGLMLIGSKEEAERSQRVARDWPGPVINFCGRLSPRLSAAAISRAALFLCNDSGPMHLAAAVGTRCVAVFSKAAAPGRWFPFGTGHIVFYPFGPDETIRSISPAKVAAAAAAALGLR